MAEYGTSLGVDDILNLSGMAQSYTNERMGRANALRGLLQLGPVSGPQNRVGTNLRALSTATHKDITARLTDRMLGQRLDNEDQFRGRWDLLFGEDYNEFYGEVIKNWREQVRLGISQAGEERAIRDQAIQELELAQKQKLWPLNVESKEQAIAKEKQRIKDADLAESMSVVALHAAQDDIKAIRKGANYYETVQKRIANETDGWTKVNLDYYKALMDEADLEPDPAEITRLAKLAEADATQYVVDMTIKGVESGMSVEGAYSNAVSAVRSGAVAGKFNDKDALRKLEALGHDVVPPTTSWVFDFTKQKAVKVSERTLRQNPGNYGPPLSAVNGKLSENFFIAGMEMLMADIANPEQVNPMTFDILYYYQLNGLSKLREEDVEVMGRWSAAAQALRSAARPASVGDLEMLRNMYRPDDDEDTDVQPAGS
jgi:hypothetical protein